VAAVVGAVAGSQVPGFMQHYMQRLGGHLDEAERNLQGWRDIAGTVGSSGVADLANSYVLTADPKVIAAGQKCMADITRVHELQGALTALQDASVWSRPFVFIRNLDPEIAKATLGSFTMNVPLDIEGLFYAASGLVLCLLLYLGLRQAGIMAVCRLRPKSIPEF